MKIYFLAFLLFLCVSGYSQTTINNYKYVLVPERFDFLKETDQYSLCTITKALLQDKGFTVYFDNASVPGDLANNKCQALKADVLEKSNMFSTELTLLLKDCHGNIIFKSKTAKTREKDYNIAYNTTLRDAFTSLDQVTYAYTGPASEPAASPAVATTVASTPEKPAATTATVAAPVQTTAVPSNQPAGTLYAQAIANGYQLIDTSPKIVLTLLKTSADNYFIAGNATANGIVLKKGDGWFFEYYQNGKLMSEKLLVKF